MTPVERLLAAETNATLARARLSDTLASLQARIEPKRLMRETRAQLVDASGSAAHRLAEAGGTAALRVAEVGGTAAQHSADTARRNPGILAGLVGVGVIFIARHRIAALFRRKPGPALDPVPDQDFR